MKKQTNKIQKYLIDRENKLMVTKGDSWRDGNKNEN